MKERITCLVIFAFIALTGGSQSRIIDSLTKIVNSATTHDTVKIKLFGDMAWELLGSDLNKALHYANKEFELSVKTARKADIAQSESDIGSVLNRLGQLDSSLNHYKRALALRLELKHEEKAAGIYANISTVLMRQSKYKEALEINFRSLKIFEKKSDPASMAKQGFIIGNIGNLYYELKMNKAAEGFFRKSLAIAKSIDNNEGLANMLINIGNLKLAEKQLDSAIYYYLTAEKLTSNIRSVYTLATIYNDLGKVYEAKSDFPKALDYYKQALAYREMIGDKFGIATAMSNIADMYWYENNPDESIKYLNQCVVYFSELKNFLQLRQAYGKLADAYTQKKDYFNAMKSIQNYSIMGDSLYSVTNSEKLTEMQVKYEAEKKENENLKLQKENTEKDLQLARRRNIMLISGGLFIVVLITGIFLFQRNRLKQKQLFDAEMLRQQEMRNKAIIEAEEKERMRIARDLHDGVGQLLSAAKLNLSNVATADKGTSAADNKFVENAMGMIDDSVREVRSISHNMMPGALSKHGLKHAIEEFAEKISSTGAIKINAEFSGVQHRLDQTAELIVYRVIQELTGNCIKHAGASALNIQMIGHDDELIIMVEDNGKGFDTSVMNQSKGIGLKNIVSRIGFLNGTVDFDSSPGRGTTVVIEIPLHRE